MAWACYALLWAAAITSTRWAPEDASLWVVLAFGVGTILAALATLWATVRGVLQVRSAAGRSLWFRGLVALSAVGVACQLVYTLVYWYGPS